MSDPPMQHSTTLHLDRPSNSQQSRIASSTLNGCHLNAPDVLRSELLVPSDRARAQWARCWRVPVSYTHLTLPTICSV
eukprot:15477218-Alexandrium_andersonii.AAC.1